MNVVARTTAMVVTTSKPLILHTDCRVSVKNYRLSSRNFQLQEIQNCANYMYVSIQMTKSQNY